MLTKWNRCVWIAVALAAQLLGFSGRALAQSDLQIRITQVDNSAFPTVTVYVSVTNSAGEPVGVDPAGIQILENEAPMQLLETRGGGQGQAEPFTTMLVMDISGSMDKNGKLDSAKQAAITYVSQMRSGDQAGLMTYDTQVYYPQSVTSDPGALITAINLLRTGGDTSMFDALIEAEKALEGMSGRKAIIVLTDGLDNHSQSTADQVIEQIGPSGLTISTIGFGDASTASQAGLDEPTLRALAERSGGLYSYASDASALSSLYQRYGRVLQSEYAITYVSPATLRDGVNRNLSVSLSQSGVTTASVYNPGGVLPEVSGSSLTLFLSILGGLLLMLILPYVFGHGTGIFKGIKPKGRIKLAQPASPSKKPNIKIK
ncbi:MAG: VWA domain-containing protein [Chloroflexi bacterium]|nr:VWA domain-containing protein [Chloroflexota bacterium]